MGPFLPSLFLAGLALSLMPSAHQGASCQAATVGGPSGRQELQQGALLPAAAQQQQLMRPDRLQQQQEWEQELAGLKEQILSHVANDLEAAWRTREAPASQQEPGAGVQKRMFVPVSGLPGEAPTIKRQIRYHQCYFNPISCFKRK